MSLSANGRGALLMVGSMLAFAFEDLFLKRAAMALPPGQVVAMVGVAGAACFWAIAAMKRQPILTREALRGAALLRSLSEGVATMLYVTALALIPLTVNSAILQASPLAVTMGAALVLREPVGWRRWTAIGVGFIGVLVILRPGTEGFSPASLLTVVCVLLLVVRDLATRVMPAAIGTFQLTTWAYLSLIPAGLILMRIAGDAPAPIDSAHWADLAGAVVTGLFGYWAVTAAMRSGDVSAIAPFRYTRLVFAVVLAMLFLGERPDLATMIGAALIIGSGLYTLAREARLRHQQTKAAQSSQLRR